jgi:hypothetical protein
VSGTGCADSAGTFGEVFVGLDDWGGPAGIDDANTTADGLGNWTVELDIPHAVGPGRYPVLARCDALPSWGEEQGFTYGTVTLTVIPTPPRDQEAGPTEPAAPGAPAPGAVRVKPRYTG